MIGNQSPQLIGEDPAWLEAQEHVSRLAPLDRPCLIIGERGTGKELIGERMHFLSRRWEGPFVKVNCAALSEQLLDSELFGHERGAFTGATERRLGRFELANGGTLFLDEIATASMQVQEKLLRVVEYGEFQRLGGEKVLTTNVRVVAATNEDLPSKAASGEFRADLLDRLAFDVVTLPPLRARPADISLLADFFARRMAREMAEDFPGFAPSAIAAMEAHTWPGNVRELRNFAQRITYRAIADHSVDPVQFDPGALAPLASPWRPTASLAEAPKSLPDPDTAPAAPPPPVPDIPIEDLIRLFATSLFDTALPAHARQQRKVAQSLGHHSTYFR